MESGLTTHQLSEELDQQRGSRHLRLIAEALELEPNDPAVVAAFDRLVLRGQLVPFVEVEKPLTYRALKEMAK